MFKQRGGNENNKGKKTPCCIFCKSEHWSDTCKSCVTTAQRKTYFSENKLCFNCGIPGHRARHCLSRGCFHCGEKHRTSLHDPKDPKGGSDPLLTGYSTANEEVTLPSIIPVKVEGEVFLAFLDTGSGKNFISKEAINKLQLLPARQESKEIITVYGTKRQYMPIYNVTIESLDGTAKEDIELAGSTMQDLTTIKRLDLNKLKWNYEHTKDKRFYVTTSGEYPIHMILTPLLKILHLVGSFTVEKLQLIYACLQENRPTTRNCTHWMYLALKTEGRMINWMSVRRLEKALLGQITVDVKLMCHGFQVNMYQAAI